MTATIWFRKKPTLGQCNIQQETESWSREIAKSQISQLRLQTLNCCILLCVASMQTEHLLECCYALPVFTLNWIQGSFYYSNVKQWIQFYL